MRVILVILIIGGTGTCYCQDSLLTGLQHLYLRYQTISKNPQVAQLVALDQDLRRLIKRFPATVEESNRPGVIPGSYEAMGVSIEKYSEVVGYSGKLLTEAHRLNPVSPLRDYTLYAAACESDESSLPNVDSAEAYVAEFPDGPYIREIYTTLARFYCDLYQEIRSLIAGEPTDYIYDCYSLYISAEPLPVQLNKVQQLGLHYFQLGIERDSSNAILKAEREDLKTGTINGWYFCGD